VIDLANLKVGSAIKMIGRKEEGGEVTAQYKVLSIGTDYVYVGNGSPGKVRIPKWRLENDTGLVRFEEVNERH
jgi:hypothetical protein